MRSAGEQLDTANDDAPHLNGLAILGNYVGVRWVGCAKLDATCALVEVLDRALSIHHGHHDTSVLGADGPIHHNDASVINACLPHGVTAHAPEISRLGVFDQQLHYVQPLHREVICRGGEARPHMHACNWKRQRQHLNRRVERDRQG